MSFVVPGEVLATEEEAIPIRGAYIDGKGYIRSTIIGLATLDRYKKNIDVKPLVKRELTLKPNSIVEGLVTSASDEVAIVKIYSTQDQNTRVEAVGLLHISQITSEYITSLLDYVRPGDIVKARVLNSTPPYLLSIKEPSTGVLTAQCSNCGGTLYLHQAGYLVCKSCGRQEKRKLAVGYLYVLR